MTFSILGTGSALPSLCISNEELTKAVDTSDEWIASRTGIRSRYICGEESLSDLAFEAAQQALLDSGVKAEELDLIICATVSNDYLTPSLACVVQRLLGASCPAFDVSAACAGFLYGLDIAAAYYTRQPQLKVLVIGAERLSRITDWTDRSTCVIFADGAGACVLGPGDDLLSILLHAEGQAEPLYAKSRDGNCPYHPQSDEKKGYLHMAGQDVFKFAVSAMTRDVKKAMALAGITPEQVDYVLPHQANIRIIQAAANRLAIDKDKYLINIDKRGNNSAATVPTLLDEANKAGKLKKGNLLAMSSFGAGLTSAACIIRWGK